VPALGVLDRGLVRVLVIDNPDKRNALDAGLLGAIERAVREAPGGGARCLVLRGAGDKAFSSGFDLDTLGPPAGDGLPDAGVERTMAAVESCPLPTIAFVNGHAFGAGCELAAACDLRVARPGIQLGMPPAKLGIVYAPAGLWRFALLMGLSRAKELFFTGQPVSAERALSMGLVDRVVPDAEEAALALAAEIAVNAPLAVQGTKAILGMLSRAALSDEERARATEIRRRAFDSEDAREGRAAFLAKRPAEFKGR
jgi:enoyl-CoA hydratase/carnithine racemase